MRGMMDKDAKERNIYKGKECMQWLVRGVGKERTKKDI
jgi:hypothetical protein